MGKRMEDQLRFAVAYWHSFAWEGGDPFGGRTFDRPWYPQDTMERQAQGRHRLRDVLGAGQRRSTVSMTPMCARNLAISPRTRRTSTRSSTISPKSRKRPASSCCGARPTCSANRRFMSGAATNPDPDVFAFAAATVKTCMDATHKLGGENYVLWGGREGYETLLNTDLKREDAQLGRFLNLVVEYKHKIGFKGTILIEPKPQEPTKHQYDYDVATVYGFLKRHGLENEVKVNIEQGHAILAGHSFEHEWLAQALGIFGSIDMNRNDYQSGWDTDQFPNNVPEVALAYYHILKAGGFTTGGTNFDAKLRRQSIDAEDLL
jgi:xylose isomerase